jgi:long-chain acyl-CoA synthetase
MSAERIDAVVATFAGVMQAAVFAANDTGGVGEVWAAVVSPEQKLDVEALRAHCRVQIPSPFVPVHVVTLEALPLNDMGKVDRLRLKELVMAATKS